MNWKFWRKEPPRHKTGADLEYAVTDLDGKMYFRIPSVMAMPIERFGKIQELVMFMTAGLTGVELTKLVEVAEKEMENLVAGKPGSLAKVGAVINELKTRQNLVIHTELLYHFVAVHYIREDEAVELYNDQIQLEKVEAFKKMTSQGGAYAFFSTLPELANINRSLNLSPEEWEKHWQDSMTEQRRLKKMLELLRSERKLEAGRKTLKVNSTP